MGFFLKSARGEWLGGLLGNIWGGWLHVTHLWVASPACRLGNSNRLLQAAEKYAVERGCNAATLETHSYEGAAILREMWVPGVWQLGRLPAVAYEILSSQAAGSGSDLGSVDSTTRWRVGGEDPPRRG